MLLHERYLTGVQVFLFFSLSSVGRFVFGEREQHYFLSLLLLMLLHERYLTRVHVLYTSFLLFSLSVVLYLASGITFSSNFTTERYLKGVSVLYIFYLILFSISAVVFWDPYNILSFLCYC